MIDTLKHIWDSYWLYIMIGVAVIMVIHYGYVQIWRDRKK